MIRALVFFLSLAASTTVVVAKSVDLYQIDQPVSGRTIQARSEGIKNGLAKVLVRASGEPSIVHHPLIQHHLNNAESLLRSYNYFYINPNDKSSQLMLHLRFDRLAVQAWLREAEQTYWSALRPTLLLLLSSKDRDARQLWSEALEPELQTELEETLAQRGLNSVFPLLDLADQKSVSPVTLMITPFEVLKPMVMRYNAQVPVLLQFISSTENLHALKCILFLNGQKFVWSFKGKDEQTVMMQAADAITNKIKTHYKAVDNTGRAQLIHMSISHVHHLDEYMQIKRMLKQLSGVQSAEVVSIDKGALQFSIVFKGGIDHLLRVIAHEGILVPDESIGRQENDQIHYRLVV